MVGRLSPWFRSGPFAPAGYGCRVGSDMNISNALDVNAARSRVWEALLSPEILSACAPGCESAEQTGETSYRAVIAMGVAGMQLRFNLVIDLEEIAPQDRILARIQGEEGGRASSVRAAAEVTLAGDTDGPTIMAMSSDVALTGRLGKFGMGMMKKLAGRLSADFNRNFKAALEAGDGA